MDKYRYFYLVYAEFDFKSYKDVRREIFPLHSEKQLGNSRYWQGHIKRLLKDEILRILSLNRGKDCYIAGSGSGFSNKYIRKYQKSIYSLESLKVDVFNTLRNNNIDFEMKSKNKVLLVCMLCSKSNLILENTPNKFF